MTGLFQHYKYQKLMTYLMNQTVVLQMNPHNMLCHIMLYAKVDAQ